MTTSTVTTARGRRRGWVAVRTFARAAESIATIRAWVRRRLRAARVEPDVVDATELLISEVATNAVRHGHGDEITVRLDLDRGLVGGGPVGGGLVDGALEAAVHDQGFDGTPGVRRAEPDDTGGRGLAMVQAISQSWGTRVVGTGKWVWFRLPGRPQAAVGADEV
jgi:anti-sigma regulatory factor (Ser/Thr protein kinase)